MKTVRKIRSRVLGCDVELPPGVRREEIGWILYNSTGDISYNPKRLNCDEIMFCIEHEDRKSGLTKLLSEARRRELLPKAEGGVVSARGRL